MAAVFPSESVKRDSAKMFRASESCSVCLDAVNDSGERSIAKLKCGHHFHLDCIGSAFNAKGAMQCPNCRHVEDGQWLYANGSRWTDDYSVEDAIYEDDYDYPLGHDPFSHFEWCPYQHGSSYPQFQVSLGDIDGSIGCEYSFKVIVSCHNLPSQTCVVCGNVPEVVVNVSYNYNESGGASSPPPVCPHHAAHPRQPQGAEDSRMRIPVSSGPLRSLEMLGSPIGGSVLGDGDVFNSPNSMWGPRHSGVSSFPAYSGDTSGLADRTRVSPELDLSFLARSGTTFYGDAGSGLSAHERFRSWSRTETERASSVTGHGPGSIYTPQHPYSNGSHMDSGSVAAGPCPRPLYMHGQAGTSQPQPQSSSIRNALMGSSRRSRPNVIQAPFSAGGRTASSHSTSGEINRRSSQSWVELPATLGQEPPVPGLESHGPGYHSGGQGFVPWRRESSSGSSNNLWMGNPDPLWQPGMRSTSDLHSNGFQHVDFVEGHGSSVPGSSRHGPLQTDFDLFQNSLYMDYTQSFGREGSAEVGSSIPHCIQLRPQR